MRFAPLLFAAAACAQNNVVVRPAAIDDYFPNPGMGIQTFQRFAGQALYPTLRWSEEGPAPRAAPSGPAPDFPASALSYCRWFWADLEPEPGKYRWDILDTALAEARRHGQTLDFRLMPYDQGHPLPAWYRNSGARRANKPEDSDGKIWSPDADDPLYLKHWGALVRTVGSRYDGHPALNSVDISTVGYWGEGWGPHLPSWERQRELIDLYFDAFPRTPLLMNFDEPRALKYGVERGAGWRLDCWGDLGGRGRGMMHMLDLYPQQVVRTGIQDAWEHAPVSLETCGTPGAWKKWSGGYTVRQLQDILDQAIRWHATSINIKSTPIPEDWKPQFTEFLKRVGYRFVLRKLEYPQATQRGMMMPVRMWWLNEGIAPPYVDLQLSIAIGPARLRTPAPVRKWLPGDALFEGSVYVPETLPAGAHRLRVAILDERTGAPIRLAIAGRQEDGWYDMGEIRVESGPMP
jgi:hypothetical protein